MALADVTVRQAKKATKPYKITDARGLYIEIRPTGKKLWRYRYRMPDPKTGKRRENVYAIGEYPEISLDAAREKRNQARRLVKQGIHPAHDRHAKRAEQITEGANTFEAIGREWLQKKWKSWAESNREYIKRTLEREVFPYIGRLPIKSVTPAHILTILQRVEAGGAPTVAVLIRQWCFRIFGHAIATLRAGTNPAAGDIREAIHVPKPQSHPPLEKKELPKLLEALAGYGGDRVTVIAMRLVMLTFVRSQELRGAKWEEFDLDAAEWRIPAERMKMRTLHIVPLSEQAVALLRELNERTGWSPHLFPNTRTPGTYMAATTLNAALVRLGYKHKFSPHGFRTTASTMLNEMGYRPDLIERQLAHVERNRVRATYNRAEYLAERRQMMQGWADEIDAMASSDRKVVSGRFRKTAA
jgi:integrase